MPTICVLEVGRVMYRERGEEAATECLVIMSQGTVVSLEQQIAASATVLGVDHGLPLADGVIHAVARVHGAGVWTHDPHFRDLPGVRLIET